MDKMELKRERHYCSKLGWSLLLVLVWTFLSQQIIFFLYYKVYMPEEVFYSLSFILPYLFYFPVCRILCPKKRMPASAWNHVSLEQFWGWFVTGIFIMLVGNIAGSALDASLCRLVGKEPVSLITETVELLPLPAVVAGVCVIGPISEELVFRGLIANRLSWYGEKPAAFVSALLFGMYHANIEQFFYTFGLGILLSYAYFRSGRLLLPILLHMCFNVYGGFLPLLFSKSEIAIATYAVSEILFAVAGAIILFTSRKELIWKKGLCPPSFKVVFGNVGIPLVMAVYFIETAMVYLMPY